MYSLYFRGHVCQEVREVSHLRCALCFRFWGQGGGLIGITDQPSDPPSSIQSMVPTTLCHSDRVFGHLPSQRSAFLVVRWCLAWRYAAPTRLRIRSGFLFLTCPNAIASMMLRAMATLTFIRANPRM